MRNCDGCTECCKGYIVGEAHGKPFYPGRPCHYVGEKGCTIYKKRPQTCASFKCEWLTNEELFPEWFKPNQSKLLIVSTVTKSGLQYYRVIECGQKINAEHLNYLFLNVVNKGLNLHVQINGGVAYYGSSKFLEDVK